MLYICFARYNITKIFFFPGIIGLKEAGFVLLFLTTTILKLQVMKQIN